MFAKPLRYCAPKNLNGVLAIGNGGVGQIVTNISRQPYSSDKGKKGCKEISQTEGKRVEPWPKCDTPPPMWRCPCPQEPQPPNYDPYRIKVPDVVVPPLPPSNAKWTLFTSGHGSEQQGEEPPQPHHNHPYYQNQNQPQEQAAKPEEPKDESFIGMIKGFFERLKGKPKGDNAMITGLVICLGTARGGRALPSSGNQRFQTSESVFQLTRSSPRLLQGKAREATGGGGQRIASEAGLPRLQ